MRCSVGQQSLGQEYQNLSAWCAIPSILHKSGLWNKRLHLPRKSIIQFLYFESRCRDGDPLVSNYYIQNNSTSVCPFSILICALIRQLRALVIYLELMTHGFENPGVSRCLHIGQAIYISIIPHVGDGWRYFDTS